MGMEMSTLLSLYGKPSTNNSHAVSLKQRRNHPCIMRIDHTLCTEIHSRQWIRRKPSLLNRTRPHHVTYARETPDQTAKAALPTGLAEPRGGSALAATADRVPDADLLVGVLLLEVLEGVHVQLPAHRLALLPPDLLLLDRVPQLHDRIPLLPCEPGHVVVRVLRKDVNGGLRPDKQDIIFNTVIYKIKH